jgi:trk system potassium uptake protein TrkH
LSHAPRVSGLAFSGLFRYFDRRLEPWCHREIRLSLLPKNSLPVLWFRWFRQHILRNPARMLVLSFGGLILSGTFLLLLPAAATRQPIGFVDALFTITSATCVTGLSVFDVGTRLSRFGQIVLLIYIQVGGLGFLTFSTLIILLIRGRLSFGGKELIETSFSQRPMGTFVGLLKTIFVVTTAVEMVGAAFLYWQFREAHPPAEALWFSVFHSISAFCNAGFSLYPDNFSRYVDNWPVCLTICGLIISGGLGFVVFYEVGRTVVRERHFDWENLNFHTRLTLAMTAALIAAGALVFLVLELGNVLKPFSWSTKIIASLFQAITPRTAGYNTVDYATLTNSTLFFTIFLMFIGGSSGSCAGGIKTSTFAVLLAYFRAQVREYDDVELLHRRVPAKVVSKAFAVTLFSLIVILAFTFVILVVDYGELQGAAERSTFLPVLFEVTSAYGTVGLSTGITPTLSDLSKVLISIVMFIGRVGPLTVAVAAVRSKVKRHKLATENLLIG